MKNSPWISVLDYKPPMNTRVFAMVKGFSEPVIGTYNSIIGKWFFATLHGFSDDVTHWMYIPPLPNNNEDNSTIIAYIHGCGEADVGINDVDTEVDTCIFKEDLNSDLREFTRKGLSDLFREIWDTSVGVSFSDECLDCGKVDCDGKCTV